MQTPATATDSTIVHSLLKFNKFAKYFTYGNAVIPGLVALLKSRFYPRYDFTRATKDTQEADETEYTHRQHNKTKNKKGEVTGAKLGVKLEKQVDIALAVLKQYENAPLRLIWDAELTKKAPIAREHKAAINALMPQTRALFKELSRADLHPIATQVPVANSHKGRLYATAVDLLCKNRNGEHVLIELKCGFERSLTKTTNTFMRAPLQLRCDSPCNQHQLQLAATREMYIKTFPQHVVGKCFVLLIQGSKARQMPLLPWALAIESWGQLIYKEKPPIRKKRRSAQTASKSAYIKTSAAKAPQQQRKAAA